MVFAASYTLPTKASVPSDMHETEICADQMVSLSQRIADGLVGFVLSAPVFLLLGEFSGALIHK